MRAVIVETPGGIERLVHKDVPDPVAGPGEVLIEVAYAAANWGDTQKRRGVYPDPVSYPAIIGLEVSGIIRATGDGVDGLKPGQRVAAITGPSMLGGYAELCTVGAAYVIPLADEIPLETGAAFPVVSLTAYHLLHSAHQTRQGERILVHAIGGGVGLALTQLGMLAGATVIGTVGGPGKGARATACGAALVIDRSQDDFVAKTLEHTNGEGVDLVIDSLGGDILPRSFDCVRTYGRIINIGEAAGYPDFDIRPKLYENSTSLAGFEVLHAMKHPALWRAGIEYVVKQLQAGRLNIPVEKIFPFEKVRDMHQTFEKRGISGKLLLKI